jgi:hypothetical protein
MLGVCVGPGRSRFFEDSKRELAKYRFQLCGSAGDQMG